MIKTDIIDNVYNKVGFTKNEATEAVEIVFKTIKETLQAGENITLSGFGNFVIIQKNERPGRNPKTGESVKISARKVLSFRPTKKLKELINKEF